VTQNQLWHACLPYITSAMALLRVRWLFDLFIAHHRHENMLWQLPMISSQLTA